MKKRYENFSPEIEEPEDNTRRYAGVDDASSGWPEESAAAEKRARRSSVSQSSSTQSGRRSGRNGGATAEKRERREGASTRRRTRRSGDSSSSSLTRKSAERPSSSEMKDAVSEWANGRTLKLLAGIFMGLFGAYLCVVFISYLSACIHDQSIISSQAIGTAEGISNSGGEAGARMSSFLINDTFGLGSLVIVVWLLSMSMRLLAGVPRFKPVNFTIKCFVALITVSLIVGLATIGLDTAVNWGGLHGRMVNEFIVRFFGWTGAAILCVFMVAVFIVICLRDIAKWLKKLNEARLEQKRRREALRAAEEARREAMRRDAEREVEDARRAGDAPEEDSEQPAQDTVVAFGEERKESEDVSDSSSYVYDDALNGDGIDTYVLTDEEEIARRRNERNEDAQASVPGEAQAGQEEAEAEVEVETALTADTAQSIESPDDASADEVEIMEVKSNTMKQGDGSQSASHTLRGYRYTFPPKEILRPGVERIQVDSREQYENQEKIRETLLEFKIPIDSINATVGPTVTLYEIVPAKGVKVSSISSLADDIALRLSAIGVRIIAPIPGRGTVGIEVANKDPQIVSMRSVLNSERFTKSKYRLPIALGATIENDVYIADLAKMPHLLVAGATGQGKSVGLNAILASLLYCKTPDELKLVMVDPKMVEFALYAKIEHHYLAKIPGDGDAIITDMDKAVATLNSLCKEMDDRYRLLKGHARNVEEYNDKFRGGQLNTLDGHRYLPYIVVIVDEFADLIMTAGREVEMPIARLAQKARAVGMHVIIATQRPSTKVITGNIKANFPARISFKVTSGVDSKTILDETGAQQLIGRGDMLIKNGSETVRVQCAFIDTPEVEQLVEYVSEQPHAPGAYLLPEPDVGVGLDEKEQGYGGLFQERDPLLIEAGRTVVMASTASTSSLQRRFSIGYNRAGKIMDQLEALGVVGASTGGKPRAVLMDAGAFEDLVLTL